MKKFIKINTSRIKMCLSDTYYRSHINILRFVIMAMLFSLENVSYGARTDDRSVPKNIQEGIFIETISGDEYYDDTLVTKNKTWVIRIPDQDIILSFYGYSNTLDKDLFPESKTHNIIKDIKIKVGEMNYKYELPYMRIRNFNIKHAISPSKEWLILPHKSTQGFIVFPFSTENFPEKSYQLYFSLIDGTGLHHEFLGWHDDNTIIMRIGLSKSFFTVLYNLENGQYMLTDSIHMESRLLCKKKKVSMLKQITD